METWFLITLTLCLASLLKAFLSLILPPNNKHKPPSSLSPLPLPPGPKRIPIISTLLWLRKPSIEREQTLRTLTSKFGPIFSLPITSRPIIFISSRSLAHQALVQNGAIFADRPNPGPTTKFISANQHNISSAGYGATWRLLRRNLTSQILHPSRVREFSPAREWVLGILLRRLSEAADGGGGGGGPVAVKVVDEFRSGMFCLLARMCFGDGLEEAQFKAIERIQHRLLLSFTRVQVLNFWPPVTRVLLRGRWKELFDMKREQEEVLIPLIRARKEHLQKSEGVTLTPTSYVDSLLELEVQEEESDGGKKKTRKLSEKEMVSACSEFLDAGTDTTTTALQWIMANLVKHPDIQAKLFEEIKGVVQPETKHINEQDLAKMPYLKAVVLEGLRRHPPGHFVLPHAVTQETELGGYTIPKNAIVNFTVADMGWDPEVWDDPMQFKPERFVTTTAEEFDITGSREIKMMPFGAGRRVCPGFGLAILHLEYFVANLVWNFKWAAVEGDEVDLSEKQEFTIVMKHPLRALISPRQAA